MKLIAAVLTLLAVAFAPFSAEAHRLRIFATVEAGEVVGYAYFVGGARARGALVVFSDAKDRELHRAKADEKGAFRWRPPAPLSLKVTVDTGEGHKASVMLPATRFSEAGDAPAANTAIASARGSDAADAFATRASAELSPEIAAALERRVEEAVARQIRPLLEAYEAAEARLRFNDIVGGIGMIIGVAGAALWVAARRKPA